MRQTVGISWLGVLGALVAFSIVIAITVAGGQKVRGPATEAFGNLE